MVRNDRHGFIRMVVRDTRELIRDIDPARLERLLGEPALDEYDAPALVVARALVEGASPQDAVTVLRDEISDLLGMPLSRRRARRLRKYFQWRTESWDDMGPETLRRIF